MSRYVKSVKPGQLINPLKLVSNYSTKINATKVDVKLLGQLRKEIEVSISQAKQALLNNNNDLDKAKLWLEEELSKLGEKKALKLKSRDTKEGLVQVKTLNDFNNSTSLAVLIELSCETDFVSRNPTFHQLLETISSTVLYQPSLSRAESNDFFLNEIDIEQALKFNLVDSKQVVLDKINEVVGKVGESIKLTKVKYTKLNNTVKGKTDVRLKLSSFAHGGLNTNEFGKVVGILLSQQTINSENSTKVDKFINQVNRQIVGNLPKYLDITDLNQHLKKLKEVEGEQDVNILKEKVLLDQPFIFDSCTVNEKVKTINAELDSEFKLVNFANYELGSDKK